LPRWRRRSVSYILYGLSPRDITTQITLMDVVKTPLTYSQESADNVMAVSAPVVLRLPPGHVHN
jgi:hypothetical protein